MSLVSQKRGGFSLFHLFGVVFGTFQPFPVCYGLFRIVPLLQGTTSQKILTCKFTINQLLQRSASVIIKQYSFFELQSGANDITKQDRYQWGNFYYKVGQFLQNIVVQKANERNGRNRFQQPTALFTPNMPGDRHFTRKNS